jgi:hypothetical protein
MIAWKGLAVWGAERLMVASPLLVHREEHIQRKIDTSVTEAKAKMAKGDKKGREII